MINWLSYSTQRPKYLQFSCLPASFSKIFLSNLTSRSIFWAVFLFSCPKINYSTKQREANLPLAIFQSVRAFYNGSRMTFSSVRSFISSKISSFPLLIGRTVFFMMKFCRLCFWLATFWISTSLFTMIFVGKSQYLSNKWKIRHPSLGWGFVWILRLVYFPVKNSRLYYKSISRI